MSLTEALDLVENVVVYVSSILKPVGNAGSAYTQ